MTICALLKSRIENKSLEMCVLFYICDVKFSNAFVLETSLVETHVSVSLESEDYHSYGFP